MLVFQSLSTTRSQTYESIGVFLIRIPADATIKPNEQHASPRPRRLWERVESPEKAAQRGAERVRAALRSTAGMIDVKTRVVRASGSLMGAIALVAGTTVGAGILALPATTLSSGMVPTGVVLVIAWAYMSAAGLLIAEVNVNTLFATGRSAVSLSTMCTETLGMTGSRFSSVVYILLHYTMLIAYMLQGSTLLYELAVEWLGSNSPALAALPPKEIVGPPLYALLLGGALITASPSLVEYVNSLAVAGVVVSFLSMLVLGVQNIDLALLAHMDPPAVVPAIPVVLVSLLYHNVVPTICYQLGCDLPRIRFAIVVGLAIPLVLFVAWCAVILGTVPYDAADSAATSGEVFDPLRVLRASGDAFGETVRIFSLLAVTTSFVGFYFGLTDFFADFLGFDGRRPGEGDTLDVASRRTPAERGILLALVLLPPVAFAVYNPTVFFSALENAGTYGILTLFGIVPAAMAWSQRYGDGHDCVKRAAPDALPGGRLSLLLMILAASAIIGVETWERLSSLF